MPEYKASDDFPLLLRVSNVRETNLELRAWGLREWDRVTLWFQTGAHTRINFIMSANQARKLAKTLLEYADSVDRRINDRKAGF